MKVLVPVISLVLAAACGGGPTEHEGLSDRTNASSSALAEASSSDKATVCHGTGSGDYQKISISWDAVGGHFGHPHPNSPPDFFWTSDYNDSCVLCTVPLSTLTPDPWTVGWWMPADHNWYCPNLYYPNWEPLCPAPGFVIAGTFYPTGVFAHAPSTLVYTLNGNYTAFSGAVGLDDGDGNCGDGADAYIWLDGQQVAHFDLASAKPAQFFNVNVAGVTTMTLTVDPRTNYLCDEAEWVATKFTTPACNSK
jgi:hypothetical protein